MDASSTGAKAVVGVAAALVAVALAYAFAPLVLTTEFTVSGEPLSTATGVSGFDRLLTDQLVLSLTRLVPIGVTLAAVLTGRFVLARKLSLTLGKNVKLAADDSAQLHGAFTALTESIKGTVASQVRVTELYDDQQTAIAALQVEVAALRVQLAAQAAADTSGTTATHPQVPAPPG